MIWFRLRPLIMTLHYIANQCDIQGNEMAERHASLKVKDDQPHFNNQLYGEGHFDQNTEEMYTSQGWISTTQTGTSHHI